MTLDELRQPHPDQERIDRESAHILLASAVKDRRCAQCLGPVVLKWIDNEYQIVCPNDCHPGGHVSAGYVEWRERQDIIDAAKVAANYPELNPHRFTPEQREANRRALYGE
jgi:hypothetical protein